MKKEKESQVNNDDTKGTFLDKYKNDQKYKAKVQLIGYGIFILVLVVYLNMANINTKEEKTKNTTSTNIPTKENVQETKELGSWLKEIGTNYEYDVSISLKSKDETGTELVQSIHYWGKCDQNKMIIDREQDGETKYFFKEDNNYYLNEADNYTLATENEVFSTSPKETVEFTGLKEFLNKATLDHVTNYSTGKKEYVYHLKIRDIIKTYQEDKEIIFNVTIEDSVVTIDVDYSQLVQESLKEVNEYTVKYIYKNNGKIETIPSIAQTKEGSTKDEQ